jgi:hypothetical protein
MPDKPIHIVWGRSTESRPPKPYLKRFAGSFAAVLYCLLLATTSVVGQKGKGKPDEADPPPFNPEIAYGTG